MAVERAGGRQGWHRALRSAHAPDICSEAAFAHLQSAGGTEEAPGLPEVTAALRGDLPRDFPTRSGAPPPSTPPSAQRPCHDGGWTLWIRRSEAPGRQQWRFRADTGALDSVTLCPPSHPSGGKKEAEPRLGPGPGHREVKGHAGVAAQPPESEKELKSLLTRVKEDSEKAGLNLNIQNTKTMTSVPSLHGKGKGKKWKQ